VADAELDRRMDARAVETLDGAPDALDLHRGDPYLARGDLLAARRDRPEVPGHLAARDQGEPSAPEPLDGVDAHRTSRSRPGSVARAEVDTVERRSGGRRGPGSAEPMRACGLEGVELAREQRDAALEAAEVSLPRHGQAVDQRARDLLEGAGRAAAQALDAPPGLALDAAALLGDSLGETHALQRDAEGDAPARGPQAAGCVLHPAEDVVEQIGARRHADPPRPEAQ